MMTQTGEAHRLPVLKERHLPGECRQSVTELLKETYGYDGFRNLEIYDDLFKNRDTLCISQGQLVENVIREAEKAYKGGEQPDNILLTAPTGAGKSLLFQLPAIYLGKEYNLLTIVVSPLKALIVDQVEGLQDVGYERVAYASSDLSPEQKMEVYRAVREGEIDLFYLSPELLLSYDIRHFIGNRRIGMVVVDEAHTVTTWGKEFRVDYWFLGRYLGALKQNLGYSFPLFALTATAVWNPKGGNDMVFDTIRSLQMEPCILYVGTVRRKNIGFDIRRLTLEEGETYDKGKQRVISGRVEEFLDGHKALLYYPFAGGIDMRIKTWVAPADWRLVASYYGKKDKAQKAAIVRDFKEGTKQMIVATKAFGMGVDISDIDRVYHVAPSSTFVDYIQEIGRAARDADVQGIAATDYHERDFYYMKRLHQTGNIGQDQLELILKKLMEVYRMKGKKEEILVSLSDFEFVVKLPRTKNKLEYEAELGQLIKTALLWLEDDLEQRYGTRLLEVSPQNLLTEGYIQDKTGDAFAREFQAYLTGVDGEEGVYRARLDTLWEAFSGVGIQGVQAETEQRHVVGRFTCCFSGQARSVAERGCNGYPPAHGRFVQEPGIDAENSFAEVERPFRRGGVACGVCRARHGCAVGQTFHRFVAGKPHRGGAQRELHQQRQEERLERAFVYRHQRFRPASVPLSEAVRPAYRRQQGRPLAVLLHSVLRFEYVAQPSFHARLPVVQRRGRRYALRACTVR